MMFEPGRWELESCRGLDMERFAGHTFVSQPNEVNEKFVLMESVIQAVIIAVPT